MNVGVEFRRQEIGDWIIQIVLEKAIHDGVAGEDLALRRVQRARTRLADDRCLVHAERNEDRGGRVVDDRALVAGVAVAHNRVEFGFGVQVAAAEAGDVADGAGAFVADAGGRHVLPDVEHGQHARARRQPR